MFENPRRGRRARHFITNVSKILDLKSSSEQKFFRKLSLGAPAVLLLSPFYMVTMKRESLSGCLIFFIRVSIAIYLVDKTTDYSIFQVRGTSIRISRVTREYCSFSPH